MHSDKISVIIPVYNTSRYLSQCIESILRQDYKNLEIILVNDASTDMSLSICRKYAEKDKRIKIIDKSINEGLELARRSGLAIATGKFILHVDSDDWLDNRKVISIMHDKAQETGADYVEIKAYRTLDKYGLVKKKITNKRIYGLIEQPELFEKYFHSYFGRSFLSVSIWGKLYRKTFLDKLEIKAIGVKMGEDLAYNIQLFPFLKKIYIIPEFGYHYRYGGMTSIYNPHLLPDLKKLHVYKMDLIDKYKYHNGRISQIYELKNILKTEIEQRIRYNQNKDVIIKFIEKEIDDPLYKSFLEINRVSSFWEDSFIKAFEKRDLEKIYDLCFNIIKKNKFKKKLLSFFATIFSKI